MTGDGKPRTITDGDVGSDLGEIGSLGDVVGAQGLTGTIVEVSLRLHRIHSGFLDVRTWATNSLSETMEAVDVGARETDHSVAWVDCVGRRAGRGVVHHAKEVSPDHPLFGVGLDLRSQETPPPLAGRVTPSSLSRLLGVFLNRVGIRVLNGARYGASALRRVQQYPQSRASFHFLLDRVPNWKRAYGPEGLLQYQMFVPAAAAHRAFAEAFEQIRRHDVPSYLGVMKRHVEEPGTATSYAVDGYSLAMDFALSRGSRFTSLMNLCHTLGVILRQHGGRLYAAKDAVGHGLLPHRRDRPFSSNLVRRWERAMQGRG